MDAPVLGSWMEKAVAFSRMRREVSSPVANVVNFMTLQMPMECMWLGYR